jgi:hypothetical protein
MESQSWSLWTSGGLLLIIPSWNFNGLSSRTTLQQSPAHFQHPFQIIQVEDGYNSGLWQRVTRLHCVITRSPHHESLPIHSHPATQRPTLHTNDKTFFKKSVNKITPTPTCRYLQRKYMGVTSYFSRMRNHVNYRVSVGWWTDSSWDWA